MMMRATIRIRPASQSTPFTKARLSLLESFTVASSLSMPPESDYALLYFWIADNWALSFLTCSFSLTFSASISNFEFGLNL